MLRLVARADRAALLLDHLTGFDFWRHVPPAFPRPTLDQARRYLESAAIVAMLESDGRYVGSLGLDLVELAWCGHLVLADRWLHVRDGHRHGSAVRHLVRFGLALARRRGVPLYLGNSLGAGRARLLQ